ncbi:MAG TPA: high-affinity branched-chain amino acid ABC transporter permease LivM [Stellaceae bacterium]|nr:high-affinity branched-chain amino acid ABC transporter permease LivM [Stellaceae bacterium]
MALAALPPPRRLDWSHLVKDASLAALVALVLAIPLVGLQTVEVNAALTIRTRFDWVAIGVAAVFVGRLLLGLARALWAPPPGAARRPARIVLDRRRSALLAGIGIALAVALPFLPFSSRYVVDLATTVMIYVMLGWGLNVVVGLAGLLDLGYVAFYAVGAYSFALFAQWFHLSFWECLPLAGLLAASFGVALGFPVLRLRGDYLAIVTLGFGEIVRIVLLNWVPVTNGPAGIGNVPRPTFLGMPFVARAPPGVTTFHDFFHLTFDPGHRIVFLYYVILALALVTNFFTLRLRRLPIGRAWEALREDEIACRALGINPTTVKLSAFAIGAMLGGFAGAFFATRQGFISPESFSFAESAIILAIVVLGGMGSQLGVVLAAMVLVILPELGRQLGDIPLVGPFLALIGTLRMLLFGAAMVGIMVWRPQGIIARREPSLRLLGARRRTA